LEEPTRQNDTSILQAALLGLQSEKEMVETAMAAIRRQLGGRGSTAVVTKWNQDSPPHFGGCEKRIADAQRKRSAAFHKAKAGAAKPKLKATSHAAPKRKLSAAAKAKLVANLRKGTSSESRESSNGNDLMRLP
jgi:hypothetical protein